MEGWGWGVAFVSGRWLVDKVLLCAKGQCLWISATPRSRAGQQQGPALSLHMHSLSPSAGRALSCARCAHFLTDLLDINRSTYKKSI